MIEPKRDIIDRLDEWAGTMMRDTTPGSTVGELQDLLAEASDEIRRLRAEVTFLEQQTETVKQETGK